MKKTLSIIIISAAFLFASIAPLYAMGNVRIVQGGGSGTAKTGSGFQPGKPLAGLKSAGKEVETFKGTDDPVVFITRILNSFFGIIGIIAILLVIYGGFLWMTAQGNDEQVKKAKNILIRSAIGIVIIFAAYGITGFIITKLTTPQ